MDIGSMIEREDFYGILKNTIETYCSTVRNKEIKVSLDKTPEHDVFRVFKLGSIISRPKKPKGALEFLLAEYNVRTNWYKHIGGKIMAYLVYYTSWFGSDSDIYIPKNVFGSNELISPQNRSIRFFDYDKQIVDCIIKEGFTDKYFKNQLVFRKTYRYDFLVPLLESGDNWFREPILKGHPLARVTDNNLYENGIKETMSYISILASDTMAFQDIKTYINTLLRKAYSLTAQAEKDKSILSATKCYRLLEKVQKDTLSIEMGIPICMSHGDLQTGNIWCNNDGKILIYDWETSGYRSVWYDSTTLLYSLRRPFGWQQFYSCSEPIQSLYCDPNKSRTKEEYDAIKSIVLMEDYLFLIEDMLELPGTWGNDIFDGNIERIFESITTIK